MIEERRVDSSDEAGALDGAPAYDAAAGAAIGMARGDKRNGRRPSRGGGLRLVGSGVDEKNGGNLTQIG